MDDFTDPGWGSLPEYPAAPSGIIKENKLESLMEAPVRLPGKKHKKSKHNKLEDAPGQQEEQKGQEAPDAHQAPKPAAPAKPDLSGFKLPTGTGRQRVKFADEEATKSEGPATGSKPKDKQSKQAGKEAKQDTVMQQAQAPSKRKREPEAQHVSKDTQPKKQKHPEPAAAGAADDAAQPAQLSRKQLKKLAKQQNGTDTAQEQAQQGRPDKASKPADAKAATAVKQQPNEKPSQQQQRGKGPHKATPAGSAPATEQQPTAQPSSAPASEGHKPAQLTAKEPKGGSGLLDKMRARLAGGRFRSLNEQLYTCKGDEAYKMMQSDPTLFEQYHSGFQQQTHGWPQQPLELAAKWLNSKPADLVVADFGCGEGKLSTIVKQKVHSFDLVSPAPHVIACNMANVPLETGSTDVAVFSLALMGTDYGSFLVEATRVLRHKGWLWIAEVRSRFAGEQPQAGKAAGKDSKHKDIDPFLSCLGRLGFQVTSLDASSNTMFFVAVLRKVNVPSCSPDQIKWPTLKACVYKKR